MVMAFGIRKKKFRVQRRAQDDKGKPNRVTLVGGSKRPEDGRVDASKVVAVGTGTVSVKKTGSKPRRK